MDCSLSGLYPSTCPAWGSLPGDTSPAGLALGVTKTHKLPDHYKVAIQRGYLFRPVNFYVFLLTTSIPHTGDGGGGGGALCKA